MFKELLIIFDEELTGREIPHLKVTGTVTKFPWKSNFPIPVDFYAKQHYLSVCPYSLLLIL